MAMMAQMANQPPIVYDVIDQAGTLVERVQFPPGRQLVGFGPDGLLYMAARERGALYLETARLK